MYIFFFSHGAGHKYVFFLLFTLGKNNYKNILTGPDITSSELSGFYNWLLHEGTTHTLYHVRQWIHSKIGIFCIIAV